MVVHGRKCGNFHLFQNRFGDHTVASACHLNHRHKISRTGFLVSLISRTRRVNHLLPNEPVSGFIYDRAEMRSSNITQLQL